ncbi:MAG: ketopantoate reductase family protein, partial [Woeseiaceae bacterium]
LISGQTIGSILDDAAKRDKLQQLIGETQAVARAIDAEPQLGPAALLAALAVVAPHKTSMLKDFEAGRALELEALTGAVLEIGARTGIATPLLSQLYEQINNRLTGR